MKSAKLIVSTSLWEGLPNSLIEASLVNSNILSFDSISGPKEIKHQVLIIDIFNFRRDKTEKKLIFFSSMMLNKIKVYKRNNIIETNKKF